MECISTRRALHLHATIGARDKGQLLSPACFRNDANIAPGAEIFRIGMLQCYEENEAVLCGQK